MTLPDNQIHLPPEMSLNFANEHMHETWIKDGRISGYYEGQIDGMGNLEIDDNVYGRKADMELDLSPSGPPFQF